MSNTEVTVVVSDCAEEDARTVFAALGEAFTAEKSALPRSGGAAAGAATVWTSVYDVADPRGRAGQTPARLAHPVTLEAQGGYRAVDRVLAELDSAFVIDAVGTAAGDQEKDVHVRLHGREA
ncbi:hypothetical protein AB0953_05450 [Streptomyces sp. NPDC046866]|uniref:hypothetical protein n=1 Tax=Streptomyces sp. NPDC046866 TaxID=3154921 RepID=UPI0034515039